MKRFQRGSGEIGSILLAVAFVIAIIAFIGWAIDQPSRHRVKKYVTKDHHVFLRESDDSWWEYIVPDTGNSQPYWGRVSAGPRAEDIEEEENATVEEETGGQPEGDAFDSPGAEGGTGDTGGDSGGDGGDGGE